TCPTSGLFLRPLASPTGRISTGSSSSSGPPQQPRLAAYRLEAAAFYQSRSQRLLHADVSTNVAAQPLHFDNRPASLPRMGTLSEYQNPRRLRHVRANYPYVADVHAPTHQAKAIYSRRGSEMNATGAEIPHW